MTYLRSIVLNLLTWSCLGLVVTPAMGQGAVSVQGTAALSAANGRKVVVEFQTHLHMVFTDFGFVHYVESEDGNTWSGPVVLSQGLSSCHSPAIAVDSAGTVAVTFLCGPVLTAKQYYTFKPHGGAWSTPLLLQSSVIESVAIAAWGKAVYLTWTDTLSVYAATFPTSLPSASAVTSTPETVVSYSLCGPLPERSSVTIGVAPGPEVLVAFMEYIDHRVPAGNCDEGPVTSGVVLFRRASPGVWTYLFTDETTETFADGVFVSTARSNASISGSQSGEFFLAYSDYYCHNFDVNAGCLSSTSRTKLAHFYRSSSGSNGYLGDNITLEATVSSVDVISRNHPGVNARVVWGRRDNSCTNGSCGVIQQLDLILHGAIPGTAKSLVVRDSEGEDPQALFFSRGPGGCGSPGCDMGSVWVDPDNAAGPRIVEADECGVSVTPILHYTFDDPSNPGHDDSGNGHQGTLYQPNMVVPGFKGNGLHFSGTNAVLEFNTPSATDLDLLGEMTGIAWIRPTGKHTADNNPSNCVQGTIFDKGANYWFQVQPDNSGILFQNESSGAYYVNTTQVILVNDWTQVAFTRGVDPTSAAQFAIYQNGFSVPLLGGPPGAPSANGLPFSLGNYSASPNACEFQGDLDEIKVFDRACTELEMNAEYTSYFNGNPPHLDVTATAIVLSGGTGYREDAGVLSYDVVQGSLSLLRGSGDFSSATTNCLVSGASATVIPFTAMPSVGNGFWFIARPIGVDGAYTYDTDDTGLIRSRDDLINASPASCP